MTSKRDDNSCSSSNSAFSSSSNSEKSEFKEADVNTEWRFSSVTSSEKRNKETCMPSQPLDNSNSNQKTIKEVHETKKSSVSENSQEEEALQNFLIETNISDVPFLDLWSVMHKKLGWKWNSNKFQYQAPPAADSKTRGELFDSSIEVVAFLDGRKSNITNKYATISVADAQKRACQLKTDILTEYFPIFRAIHQKNILKKQRKQQEEEEFQKSRTYGFGSNCSSSKPSLCDVCFLKEGSPSSVSFSPFVQCKTCSLLVHYDCYLPLPSHQKTADALTKGGKGSTSNPKNTIGTEPLSLGKGCAVPDIGLDTDGFFLCNVCILAQPPINKKASNSSQKNKNKRKNCPYYYIDNEDVEAKCDGRVHLNATCELCLRKDVRGGLKQLAVRSNNAAHWAHLTCVQSIPQCFCKDDKIHYATKSQKKTCSIQDFLQQCNVQSSGINSSDLCDACSRSGGFLVPCAYQDSNVSNSCTRQMHPLCAEISLRKKLVDKVSKCSSYKCAIHSFTNKCHVCNQVYFQNNMIECKMCMHRFHKKCLSQLSNQQLGISSSKKTGSSQTKPSSTTLTTSDDFPINHNACDSDEEWFCFKCVQEGLAKGILEAVMEDEEKSISSSKNKAVEHKIQQKIRRRPTKSSFIAASPQNNVLEVLKNKSKNTANNSNKRSVTMIEDGAEVYFTKQNKKKSSRRSSTVPLAAADDDSESSNNEGGVEEATARKAAKRTAQPKAPNKKMKEELLNKWPNPMDCAEYVMTRMIQNDVSKHSIQISEMNHKLKAQFSDWSFLLKTNHSLLFYGYGSKRHLLNDFAKTLTDEGDYVANIQGYYHDVTIDGILDSLVTSFLNGKEPLSDDYTQLLTGSHRIVKRAASIGKDIASFCSTHKENTNVNIVLHNIDGYGLRNNVAQSSLASLVAHGIVNKARKIRLVASIDNVNAPAYLWDTRTMAGFSWIWKEVTTYNPYHKEVKYGMTDLNLAEDKVKEDQLQRNSKGIQDVLRSLAPRYSETLKLLATLQLAAVNSSTATSSVEYSEFRVQCQNKMFVTSDNALRLMLNELKDHDIVSFKSGTEGTERIYIPYTVSVLQMIIDFCSNKI